MSFLWDFQNLSREHPEQSSLACWLWTMDWTRWPPDFIAFLSTMTGLRFTVSQIFCIKTFLKCKFFEEVFICQGRIWRMEAFMLQQFNPFVWNYVKLLNSQLINALVKVKIKLREFCSSTGLLGQEVMKREPGGFLDHRLWLIYQRNCPQTCGLFLLKSIYHRLCSPTNKLINWDILHILFKNGVFSFVYA